MSTTAEDVSATLTQDERASLSETDQIAELLIGEPESDKDDEKEDENFIFQSRHESDGGTELRKSRGSNKRVNRN